jgi:hypothetical protein
MKLTKMNQNWVSIRAPDHRDRLWSSEHASGRKPDEREQPGAVGLAHKGQQPGEREWLRSLNGAGGRQGADTLRAQAHEIDSPFFKNTSFRSDLVTVAWLDSGINPDVV